MVDRILYYSDCAPPAARILSRPIGVSYSEADNETVTIITEAPYSCIVSMALDAASESCITTLPYVNIDYKIRVI